MNVEGVQNALGRLDHPMVFPSDHAPSSLDCRAIRPIIGEDELNREGIQSRGPKKKSAQGGVLPTLRVSSRACNLLTLLEPHTVIMSLAVCK